MTTFGVLFRCGSSIGQIVCEHPGWALKQISLHSWPYNQKPRWVLSWLPAVSLSCQVIPEHEAALWGKRNHACYSKSSLCFTSLKHSHPFCIPLVPSYIYLPCKIPISSSIPFQQSSLWSLETSPGPRPLFILDCYCAFCLSHSHLLASPSSCCH